MAEMRCPCHNVASESVLQVCESCVEPSVVVKSPGATVAEARISSLALPGEAEARRLLRRALRDSEAAAQRFGWRISCVCELPSSDADVGYTGEDGTIYVKVRDPSASEGGKGGCFYAYAFVLATLLHELVHLSHLGHGKNFYRCLSTALATCGAESWVRREAASCRRPGVQLPLEYAAHHGRVALTRLLLEARADPTPYSSAKPGCMAPLARAAVNGNAKTAALLLAARANVGETREPKGQSALDKALAAAEVTGNAKTAALLLAARANVGDVREPKGQSVLDKAIAAAEAGKDGDWWQIKKVLGAEHSDRAVACQLRTSLAKDDTGHCEDRARGAARSQRKRRSRSLSEARILRGSLGATPEITRAPSMPSLPALQKTDVRHAVPLSCLSGSLAL